MKKFLICKIKPAVFLAGCFCFFFILLIFTYPNDVTNGGLNGLLICGEVIIPSLFPFMVIALFLSKSGIIYYIGRLINPVARALFNISGESAGVLLMSFIAGYPVGARLTNELYKTGKINLDEASRMLCFTVNAGPAFIVTAVGARILGSKSAGAVLLAAHVLGSVLIGIILGINSRRLGQSPNDNTKKSIKPPKALSSAFVESTAEASSSILNICAWVVLFSCVIQLLNRISLSDNIVLILSSLSEVTTGTVLLARTCNLPLLAALLGWAGFSVHCQVLSSSKDISQNILKFIFFRILHGAFSAVITYLLLKIYPLAISTGENSEIISRPSSVSIPVSISLIFMSVVLLFFIGENQSTSKH